MILANLELLIEMAKQQRGRLNEAAFAIAADDTPQALEAIAGANSTAEAAEKMLTYMHVECDRCEAQASDRIKKLCDLSEGRE